MNAIGVFDSGVGGLTVVKALQNALPHESILYLGDTARLPYGSKSEETVTRYTRRNLDFLEARQVKAVVVACNTASALALPRLESGLPLFGVIEPGAEQAATASRGRVGVIGTAATVRSNAYARAILQFSPELKVISAACPLFVPLVEEGWHEDPITVAVARRYLEPLLAERVDTLVLGCTHYPLLRDLLQDIVGDNVTLVDSADAVAARVAGELAALDRLTEAPEQQSHFCLTDDSPPFRSLATAILGREDLSFELVDVS